MALYDLSDPDVFLPPQMVIDTSLFRPYGRVMITLMLDQPGLLFNG